VGWGQLREGAVLGKGSGVQVIIGVEVEAATYVSEQYQSRIRAPSECPNCGIAQSLEAHEGHGREGHGRAASTQYT
jgi:hypothetical protein